MRTAPPVRVRFAARLVQTRLKRGIPLPRQLAEQLGIDARRYQRFERAETEPDFTLLLRICAILNTTPNDLLLE